MKPNVLVAQLSQWAGCQVLPFTIQSEERRVKGWITEHAVEDAEAEAMVNSHRLAARDQGVRMFCGESQVLAGGGTPINGIFFISAISEPQIAELCDCGISHRYIHPQMWQHLMDFYPEEFRGVREMIASGVTLDDMSGPPPVNRRHRVRKLLTSIFERQPYMITLANRLFLKAAFNGPVDQKTADWIEKRILKSFSLAGEQVEPATISEYARQHQALYISWHGRVIPTSPPKLNPKTN
jgi:hypothetical protein